MVSSGLFNQAQAGPLIDRNGAYVRYEILINEPMYNYIRENRLYNQTGLKAVQEIAFPAGGKRQDRRDHGQGGVEGHGRGR